MKAEPAILQHYHELRDLLERYRTACRWIVGALFLFIPIAIVSALMSLSTFAAQVLSCLPFGIAVYVAFRYYRRLERQGYLPCIYCIVLPDDVAETPIFGRWVCGFCHKTNPAFEFFPWRKNLCDPCPRCGRPPHSVCCWRCCEPVILDQSAFLREPNKSAWLAAYPPAPPKPKSTIDRPPKPIDEDLR